VLAIGARSGVSHPIGLAQRDHAMNGNRAILIPVSAGYRTGNTHWGT